MQARTRSKTPTSRFADKREGRRRVQEALALQTIVAGDAALAAALTDGATIANYSPGQDLMVQGAEDHHIEFILAGDVDILIHGNRVNGRQAGTHVGDMALIDVAALRSATVRARTTTVTARIEEPKFTRIARKFPNVWRALALELARRLYQRGALVAHKRTRPYVFIGSAVEGLDIAKEIQRKLQFTECDAEVWDDDTFIASHVALEDLIVKIAGSDFGVFVAGPHDRLTMRRKRHSVPRDNVVFEAGMSFGALGRERTLLVIPRAKGTKLPSDLTGITPLQYNEGDAGTLAARVGPVVTELQKIIKRLGPK
jgi:CRP/FNR family cyclic AMP-dependent transcriptional regulator